VIVEWLKWSRLNVNDCIFVFSIVGGNKEKSVSANLVHALVFAKEQQAKIIGVFRCDGGYTVGVADVCCLIPVANSANRTSHTEAFQVVICHSLVSHPK